VTTINEKKVKCGVCGKKNKFPVIGSTNTIGLPDLDTRPAEMMRSTIVAWAQRCPECGYCSSDITSLQKEAKLIVKRSEYQEQLKDTTYPEMANTFLCKAMIDYGSENYVKATWALIHAAWICDDSDHIKQARVCREKAIDMITIAEEHGQQVSPQEGGRTAVLVDLLRRTGRFEQARQMIIKDIDTISDYNFRHILDFQIGLIDKQDMSCHSIGEALNEDDDSEIDKNNTEPQYYFLEDLGIEPTECYPKGLSSTRLIKNINRILRHYEKQYRKRCDYWYENIVSKPDYKYDEIDDAYYNSTNSPLSATLRNVLFHFLKSESGTRCKAEDILNQLYVERLLWPRMNYIPSRYNQTFYPELLA